MTWKDDPTERSWENKLDEAWQAARRTSSIEAIRADSEIGGTARQRPAGEYAQLSRHIRDERDNLEQRFLDCSCFSERACEAWAERVAAIDRTAEDALAAVEALEEDFAAASEQLQRDLREIAAAAADEPPSTRDTPPLIRMHRRRGAAERLRSHIVARELLRESVRDRWLRALPGDREHGIAWQADIRRQARTELDAVARFTTRVSGSLRLLKTLIAQRDGV